MVEDFIRDHYDRRLTLLEIGGGAHPQTAWFPSLAAVVNIDISLPLLMFGVLFFSVVNPSYGEHLSFVCCNANHLPFGNNSFDGIVIFSTLHHFPEPENLLAGVSRALKANGFVAVMCEPVGCNPHDPAFTRDLLKGINEQTFSLEEYLAIFKKSGLSPISVQIDGTDLKAFLKREPSA